MGFDPTKPWREGIGHQKIPKRGMLAKNRKKNIKKNNR